MPTAEAPTEARPRPPLVREDYELDLSELFRRLARQWAFIAACVVLALVGAVAFTLMQPRAHLGVAQVLISRPRVQLSFEPRVATINDFELRPFFTHAKHPAVERAVQAKLGDVLLPAEQQPGALLERIRVSSAREDAALMELRFTDRDPAKASLVANTWAEAYLQHAQTALNPSAVAQRLVEAQLRDARSELERREQALREFEQRTGLGIALRDEGTRLELNTGASSIPATARLGTRGRQISAKSQTLSEFRQTHDRIRLLLAQASALTSAGVGLASLAGELNEVGVAASTSPDQVVAALEARSRALGASIDALTAELKQAEASLVADVGQLEHLERERDVARDAYLALAKKAEENKVGLAGDWSGLAIFNQAPQLAPVEPRQWPIVLGVAGAAGLVVGLSGAFVLDARRSRRLAHRQPGFAPLAERAR